MGAFEKDLVLSPAQRNTSATTSGISPDKGHKTAPHTPMRQYLKDTSLSRTPKEKSSNGMETSPSILIIVFSTSGISQPLKLKARPSRVATIIGICRNWLKRVRWCRIYAPKEKCSTVSTKKSTTAAASAASPNPSTARAMPMLPELLNIIGGRKVL